MRPQVRILPGALPLVRSDCYPHRVESSGVAAAQSRELDRIGAFSDGVFAIAITLLILYVEVPDVSEAELPQALRDLGGNLSAYAIGFTVIGMFWYGHHKLFSTLVRSDVRLVVGNLVLLGLIALMPFTTAVLGEYSEPISVALYAVNVGAAALADGGVELIAVRHRLAPPGALGTPRSILLGSGFRAGVFVASIPIAYLSPGLAPFVWLLLLVPKFSRAFG